jgi:Leucine rich repeat
MPQERSSSTPDASLAPAMFCRKCGYALVGLESQVCPECGRPFDPGNRKTFARRPPRGWVWRWGRRVVALLLLVALAAGAGLFWLWWGWRAEQPTIARLRELNQDFHVAPIGPERLRRVLGKRLGYLTERVDGIELIGLSVSQTEPLDLRALSHLETLRLDCELSNSKLNHLTGLKKLHTLRLWDLRRHNPDLAFLEQLPALSELQVFKTPVGKAGLEHIGRLKHLKILDLGVNRVTDADLQQLHGLSSLEELYLYYNPITDAGLDYLQGLKSLRVLWIDPRLFGSPGVAKLKQAIPGLQVGTPP